MLAYRGKALKKVDQFKYLGLIFRRGISLLPMLDACANAACKSWSMLLAKLWALQWRDRGTKLTLFESYLYSVMLFGSALWGVTKLDGKARIGVDCTGELCPFYKSCTRSLLRVARDFRDLLLYVIAAKHQLYVYITKSVC